jgi:hypothetical protein
MKWVERYVKLREVLTDRDHVVQPMIELWLVLHHSGVQDDDSRSRGGNVGHWQR